MTSYVRCARVCVFITAVIISVSVSAKFTHTHRERDVHFKLTHGLGLEIVLALTGC